MAGPTDLVPGIPDAASSPQSATADGLTATARPISDQILADRYAKAATAAANGTGKMGLRFTRMIGPPQCPVPAALGNDQGGDVSYD
jgi:hypothetical protein